MLSQRISHTSEPHNVPITNDDRSLHRMQLEDEENRASATTSASTRRDTMQIYRLVDKPLHHVTAHPWTTVTNDDELVSNLISVWLTWDKPFTNFLDHTLFLRDMKNRQTGAKYCSPMLVNAVLAWACPYSDYNEAKSINGNNSFLMTSFLVTAKSLQEQELRQKPRLTTIQALVYIALACFVQGQDRQAYQNLLYAISMAQELIQSESGQHRLADLEEEQVYSTAIDMTAWGLFNVSTSISLGYMKTPLMKPPTRRRPSASSATFQASVWTPYPFAGPTFPGFDAELFDLLCDISITAAQLSRLLLDDEEEEKPLLHFVFGQALELWDVIESRLSQIPEHLKVAQGSPGTLHLYHTYFQGLRMRIFTCPQLRRQDLLSPLQEVARKKCIDAALETARICTMFCEDYGSSIVHIGFAFATALAACTLLEQPDPLRHSTEILKLCNCLKSIVKRWPNSAALLQLVRFDALRFGTVFPPEIETLFADFDQEWTTSKVRIVSNMFPSPATTTDPTNGPGTTDMASFMEHMGQLNLSRTSTEDD